MVLSQTFVSSLLLGHWGSWAREADKICHVSAAIKAWNNYFPLATPHQASVLVAAFMRKHLVMRHLSGYQYYKCVEKDCW